MDGDLIGYGVAATDGDVGTIDHATSGAAGAYVVVDLASGVPGGKRVIPAGAITARDGVGAQRRELGRYDGPSREPDRQPISRFPQNG
jgi:hypothetical protein